MAKFIRKVSSFVLGVYIFFQDLIAMIISGDFGKEEPEPFDPAAPIDPSEYM